MAFEIFHDAPGVATRATRKNCYAYACHDAKVKRCTDELRMKFQTETFAYDIFTSTLSITLAASSHLSVASSNMVNTS